MTKTIAIHQPNYVPWCGFFYKIAVSDVFVLLDCAQYSKNSYINRSRILEGGVAKWMTTPVSASLGSLIKDVPSPDGAWPEKHLARLKNAYKSAPAFKQVWQDVEAMYGQLDPGNIANANTALIRSVCAMLDIETTILLESDMELAPATGTERLVAIVGSLSDGGTYLSGAGGKKYQDETLFQDAGIDIRYSEFIGKPYAQNGAEFVAGLSILDSIFNIGVEETRNAIHLKP